MPLKPSFLAPFNEFVARHYGKDTGKMLIHTGVVGWILSAAAQVMAIVFNDKIPKEQKMYLVPQELADAGVNILSFYTITQGCKSVASKLVKSGKLLPKSVRGILDAKGLTDKVGKFDFNVFEDAGLSPTAIKRLEKFKSGVDVTAATIGSVLSCNIVTPIVRNEIAASRQKDLVAKMHNADTNHSSYVKPDYSYTKRPSMYDFTHNTSSLKI